MESGGTLVIDAGVTVLFTAASSSISVYGNVVVNGTAAAPVVLNGLGIASTAIFVQAPASGSVLFASVTNFTGVALRNIRLASHSNFSYNGQAVRADSEFGTVVVSFCRFTRQLGNVGDGYAVSGAQYYSCLYVFDSYFADQPLAVSLACGLQRTTIERHTSPGVTAAVHLVPQNYDFSVAGWQDVAIVTGVVVMDNAGLGLSNSYGDIVDSTFLRNRGGGVSCEIQCGWITRAIAINNTGFGISGTGTQGVRDSVAIGNIGAGVVGYGTFQGCLVANNSIGFSSPDYMAIQNSVVVGNGVGSTASGSITDSWVCGSTSLLVQLKNANSVSAQGVWWGVDTTELNSTCADAFFGARIYDAHQDVSLGTVTIASSRSSPPPFPTGIPGTFSSASFPCSACASAMTFSSQQCACVR